MGGLDDHVTAHVNSHMPCVCLTEWCCYPSELAMYYLVCSVYFGKKLLLKKPLKADDADSLGTVFDSLDIEGSSDKSYYLLPTPRVENSGLSISPNGISGWVSTCAEDTVEMC